MSLVQAHQTMVTDQVKVLKMFCDVFLLAESWKSPSEIQDLARSLSVGAATLLKMADNANHLKKKALL